MANLKFDDLQRERLFTRVNRFLWICLISWVLFAVYYSLNDHSLSSAICKIESVCAIGLILLLRKRPAAAWWAAHINLGVASLGLLAEAMISGQADS
ncbi:MAG: hypothetical protein AAF497_24405, partial [Planctomycetota bacterium]